MRVYIERQVTKTEQVPVNLPYWVEQALTPGKKLTAIKALRDEIRSRGIDFGLLEAKCVVETISG